MEENIRKLLMYGMIILLVIMFVLIMDLCRKNKRNKKYVQMFESAYTQNDVFQSLTKIKESYRTKSTEYRALDKATNYLQKSCLKDYQTAFVMVETAFGGKNIEEFHDKILNEERNKMVLLLEKKEETS